MPAPRNPADTDKIRAAIIRSGKTQAQIAREIGVSDVAIHRYVTGLRSPAPGNLMKLARACGVDIRQLVTFTKKAA